MDVLSGGKIHEGVGSPKGGPLELLDLLLDGRGDGGVSNVGVDLDLEHASDDLGLELEMVLVRADDGPSCENKSMSSSRPTVQDKRSDTSNI